MKPDYVLRPSQIPVGPLQQSKQTASYLDKKLTSLRLSSDKQAVRPKTSEVYQFNPPRNRVERTPRKDKCWKELSDTHRTLGDNDASKREPWKCFYEISFREIPRVGVDRSISFHVDQIDASIQFERDLN
uniref:Uncharacterized protein n=1 Tax=Glossina austeni TaxID=7395 RepID=A0A1A9VNH7_GLOAU